MKHAPFLSLPILAKLTEYFLKRRDIAAAYLFGSHAEGAALPLSDIDIAIIYFPNAQPKDTIAAEISMNTELTRMLHKEVDLHILTTQSSLPFVNEIFHHARRIAINDAEVTARFEAAMQVRYLDYQPVQQEYLQAMEKRIEQGTYGNR